MKSTRTMNRTRHRMQSGFELIISVAIMFFIFTVLLIVYFDRQETINAYTETLEMRRTAFDIARHINALVVSGNGTNSTVILINKLTNGKTLCYSFANGRVEVDLLSAGGQGNAVSVPVTTRSMTENAFCLAGSSITKTFTNVNGFISQ